MQFDAFHYKEIWSISDVHQEVGIVLKKKQFGGASQEKLIVRKS